MEESVEAGKMYTDNVKDKILVEPPLRETLRRIARMRPG
jgi:hypothetical protein